MAAQPLAVRAAFRAIAIAACEQWLPEEQRMFDDPLAVKFLPAGQRWLVRACRWSRLRRWLVAVGDRQASGLWASVLCRKRYADDQVVEALDAGIRQFVFLGSGMDTRPYRLVVPAGATAFELDLPAAVAVKRGRLEAVHGAVPDGVSLVGVDLEREDLAEALATAGFDPSIPAMFVCEGLTPYLTGDAFERLLATLGRSAPGSRLIFTYLRRDYLDGRRDYGAARTRQTHVDRHRIWRLGLDPDAVAETLAAHGWSEREQLGGTDYQARYLAPAGRDQPVSEIERFVSAVLAAE